MKREFEVPALQLRGLAYVILALRAAGSPCPRFMSRVMLRGGVCLRCTRARKSSCESGAPVRLGDSRLYGAGKGVFVTRDVADG
jgi:hypothetical protein